MKDIPPTPVMLCWDCDGVDPVALHNCLLGLPEYRLGLAEDMDRTF